MRPLYVRQTGTGSSDWLLINRNITPVAIGIGVHVSGNVNYTVQYTYDDPSGTYLNPTVGTACTVYTLPTLVNATTTLDGNIIIPVGAVRLTKNSGTGFATMTFTQAGVI